MIDYEIPYEGIVYFPAVVPEIDKLIDTIETTNGIALTSWSTWFAYGSSEDPYGEIKYMQAKLLVDESNELTRNNSSYILNTLVDAMATCAREYASIYEIDKSMLEFAEHALRYPETTYGINKYFEGQYMGPHVDWNEFNSDITYTIVVYLNDDYEGGELYFVDPSIDIKIKPKAGSIVMFPSKLPYLHQSCEITKGRKMLITHHWKNDSLSNSAGAEDGQYA
jgi:hypothetical protein